MNRKVKFFKEVGLMAAFMGILLVSVPTSAQAFLLISDFDDATLQGWSPEPVFNGDLFVDPIGGNPGGFMVATDTAAVGGPLLSRGPSIFSGSLGSLYGGLQWDEFVYNNGGAFTSISTFARLQGTDGTIYDSSSTLGPIGLWNTKSVLFDDPSGWILKSGVSNFEDVVSNVDALFLSMDTSTLADGNRESGIDNIGFLPSSSAGVVPEPSTIALLGVGMAGMFGLRKRREEHELS